MFIPVIATLVIIAIAGCGAAAQSTPTGGTGAVTVTSTPTGAYVSINGGTTEVTPWTYNIAPGVHQVEVDYPGYQAYVTTITVTAGGSVQVNAVLSPVPNPALIAIDSTPQGADIYVDGNFNGETPYAVGGLSPGTHQVVLVFPGYAPYTANVTVQAGQTASITAVLTQVTMTGLGDINVASQPAGASIYLDGVFQGITVPDDIITLQAVQAGSHTIVLSLNGYQDYRQVIQVNEGQATTVAAVFTPVQQPPQNGTLIVVTNPSGGQVYLDGQFEGIAPVTVNAVPVGPHQIVLKLSGFQDYSQTVQVQAGQVVPVNAVLTPAATATTVPPTTAPATTTAGSAPFAVVAAVAVAGAFCLFRKQE